MTFTITADQVANYTGQALVVYEYLTLDDEPIAEHTDPEDQAQTFTVAEEPTVPGDPEGPTDPGTGGDDLPETGAGMSWLAVAGGAMLVVGGVVLLLVRRKASA